MTAVAVEHCMPNKHVSMQHASQYAGRGVPAGVLGCVQPHHGPCTAVTACWYDNSICCRELMYKTTCAPSADAGVQVCATLACVLDA